MLVQYPPQVSCYYYSSNGNNQELGGYTVSLRGIKAEAGMLSEARGKRTRGGPESLCAVDCGLDV